MRARKRNSNDNWQSIREQAAIAVMQGSLSILTGYVRIPNELPNEIAEFAVACADALIKELKRNNYGK